MAHNVGNADRVVRTVLGLGAVVWAFSIGVASAVGIVLLVLAAVLLVTAAIGFCPLYRLLGIRTTGVRQRGARPVAR